MLYLNNTAVNVTMFPDNTSQVWKIEENHFNWSLFNIRWDFESEGEFLHLCQLKDLLMSKCPDSTYQLELSYLPYGRQDKEISNTTTFALRSFAKMLNYLNFSKVSITDPHSAQAVELIRNARAVYLKRDVEELAGLAGIDAVCFPDKGAKEKYIRVYNFATAQTFLYGDKVRDQLTGAITGYSVDGDCLNKRVLVVDDICDGGATFVHLTKKLLEAGAKDVILYVTHGVFSKGTKVLFDAGISQIFTKDGKVGKRSLNIQA